MPLEFESGTHANETIGSFGPGWGFEQPYAQWSEKLLDPPAGSEVVEDWTILRGIAAKLGKTLNLKPISILDPIAAKDAATPIPPEQDLTSTEVWAMLLKNSPVPFAEIRANAGPGRLYDRPAQTVAPKPDGWTGKLDIGAAPMLEELAAIAAKPPAAEPNFPFKMISRRLHDIHNSNWLENITQRRRAPTNHAYMNPADMQQLGLAEHDIIEITSRRAAIHGVVAGAPDVRPGCISMAHAWGVSPDEAETPGKMGTNIGRLTSVAEDYDRYTGIPLMSAIPVRVVKLG
jgi:anaerobic selenocysteine-containing dehydrogenase